MSRVPDIPISILLEIAPSGKRISFTSSGDHNSGHRCGNFGSCVLKASVDRYLDRQSADIWTDTRPICRLRLDRYSVDMLFELIDRWSTLSVGMSVDTRPTPRPICRWCIGRLSVVYRSTVGGIGVLLTVVLLK